MPQIYNHTGGPNKSQTYNEIFYSLNWSFNIEHIQKVQIILDPFTNMIPNFTACQF